MLILLVGDGMLAIRGCHLQSQSPAVTRHSSDRCPSAWQRGQRDIENDDNNDNNDNDDNNNDDDKNDDDKIN